MISGTTLLMREIQSNPPVLMLHGNPTWSFFYRRLINALKENHRVIAPDHMGCGLSDKPQDYPYCLSNHMLNVEKLITHLELKHITLICHDWGGAIGMGVAARRPDLFDRFVVLNTAAWRSSRMPKRICRLPHTVSGRSGGARVQWLRPGRDPNGRCRPLDNGCQKGLALPLQQLEKSHCHTAVCAGHPHEAIACFLRLSERNRKASSPIAK
jgi:pimeloyl-ACP methyl ester carboxylesterase